MSKPDSKKTAEDIYFVLSLFNWEQFRIEFSTLHTVTTFRVYRRLEDGKEAYFGGLIVSEDLPEGLVINSHNEEYRKSWPLMVKGFIHSYLQTKYGDFPWDNDPEQGLPQKQTKGKQGPHNYTDAQKEDAIRTYLDLGKNIYALNLVDYLCIRFGTDANGSPKVAESTFHEWKREYLKKNKRE